LVAKLNAYALQDAGADTVDANLMFGLPVDARCFDAAARILEDLGTRSIRLLTNNPSTVVALERLGVRIGERVALEVPPTEESSAYLLAKRTRMGHMLGTHVARDIRKLHAAAVQVPQNVRYRAVISGGAGAA